MSLILDALKKLDRDRIAKSGDRRNIAAEILKAGELPRKSGILPLVSALAVTATLAAVITYLVFGASGSRMGSTNATAPPAPVQSRQNTSIPLPPAPAPVAVAEQPPAPSGVSMAAAPAAVSEVQSPGKSKQDRDASSIGRMSSRLEKSKGETPARSGAASLLGLKISGIVWEESPSERKAVINGIVTREGDSVAGVKVLQIHPTHVLVSSGGKSFKVNMFE